MRRPHSLRRLEADPVLTEWVMSTGLKAALLGAPRNLFDPHIHHRLALVAFFAWVGLGSDGLSSSCYGPEEIFRQIGDHRHLALYLAVAIIGTVFLISASYRQIIEVFPAGGGGYLVATKLLGPVPGVISGGALVVDYILTIAISVAAGGEAIFSFLPAVWQPFKLTAELVVVAWLILLNLRGVKESVIVLTPIFLAFIITHVGLVGYGILRHANGLGSLLVDTTHDTRTALSQVGALGVGLIVLRAFALGGGTFTGIEAVSNGVGILREPRVENGKRTMLYMATSLAFTAGGILLCYLLNDVRFEAGRTLNASLWSQLTGGWRIGAFEPGPIVVGLTLLSEGALLFVAAQTGFVDGPRILAAMAVDEWVPRRFRILSERLVTQNGILTMGIAAAVVLAYTRGAVGLLVVMYSINVFLTFTLSQVGMARHWLAGRRDPGWRGRFAVTTIGAFVTGTILVITVTLKFSEGGWVTLLATSGFVIACFAIRRHYGRVRRHMRSLDDTLLQLPLPAAKPDLELAVDAPTAIVLVERYDGLGVHTLLSIQRLFPRLFRNVVFVSVGLVDSAQFKGVEELGALEERVRGDLVRYVELAGRLGLYAEYRCVLGIDMVEELEHVCVDLTREFPRAIVFAGQLVFEREDLLTRPLHHQTAISIQRRLEFSGIQVIVMPIRVWESTGTA
jgi:amino acid transporter